MRIKNFPIIELFRSDFVSRYATQLGGVHRKWRKQIFKKINR